MTAGKRLEEILPGPFRLPASAFTRTTIVVCILLVAVSAAGGLASPDGEIMLWEPCTREQAERWASDAQHDGKAALRAASCYATLLETGGERPLGLEDARRGRRAAEAAVRSFPDSGLAHYLAAYLIGLEAERNPLRGLGLVPMIEREAGRAADLSPGVDRGGPDRMLGELYLRAPTFPLSVGNSRKAVTHYRRAVSLAPAALENRLGLAESLLAENEAAEACVLLDTLLAEAPPSGERRSIGRKALDLVKRRCALTGSP
jgi:hypothetical protein